VSRALPAAQLDLGVDLLGVVARLHRWATRQAGLPMSQAHARLLAQIDELGPARIGDLARADHCSQPTMTTQVQRLEELGLVSRAPDPVDARAVLVDATRAGRRLLGEMRRARAAAVAPLLAQLSAAERDTIRGALDIMTALLDSEGSRAR
jgi:DNA-binding MarR family transcriptional regulator